MIRQGAQRLLGLAAGAEPTLLILGLLALGGMATVAFATDTWGIGVTPDSVYYLDAARHLADGKGLTASINAQLKPLAHRDHNLLQPRDRHIPSDRQTGADGAPGGE